MKTAYKYQTDWKKSYAGKRKAREKYQLGRRTCCMWTNRPITVSKTKNWGSLALREENVTAPRRDPRAVTCCAVGVGTTPTLSGTWKGASASLSGAATCAAGGARPWLTYTPASKMQYRKYGQTIHPVWCTQLLQGQQSLLPCGIPEGSASGGTGTTRQWVVQACLAAE